MWVLGTEVWSSASALTTWPSLQLYKTLHQLSKTPNRYLPLTLFSRLLHLSSQQTDSQLTIPLLILAEGSGHLDFSHLHRVFQMGDKESSAPKMQSCKTSTYGAPRFQRLDEDRAEQGPLDLVPKC